MTIKEHQPWIIMWGKNPLVYSLCYIKSQLYKGKNLSWLVMVNRVFHFDIIVLKKYCLDCYISDKKNQGMRWLWYLNDLCRFQRPPCENVMIKINKISKNYFRILKIYTAYPMYFNALRTMMMSKKILIGLFVVFSMNMCWFWSFLGRPGIQGKFW